MAGLRDSTDHGRRHLKVDFPMILKKKKKGAVNILPRPEALLAVCAIGADAGAGICHRRGDYATKRYSCTSNASANDGEDQSVFSCGSTAFVSHEVFDESHKYYPRRSCALLISARIPKTKGPASISGHPVAPKVTSYNGPAHPMFYLKNKAVPSSVTQVPRNTITIPESLFGSNGEK